ncbi:MAG: hypothetical protein H6696_14945 [Deferribacteres bacterium]|nr:hypothetical protein [candidate division KSB1 bacterium]MCB9503225.1 hypothetical protein [Deferribacteres bacterium]
MELMNTILSKKDAVLLEQILASLGQVASFDNIKKKFKRQYTELQLRQMVDRLTKRGWLVRIKKGLYVVVTDITSLSSNNVSLLHISQALNEHSYISLTSALHYYGLVDQLLNEVTAITNNRTRQYQFQDFIFSFSKVSEDFYFGYSEKRVEGKLMKIADFEKVVLDILYLKKDTYSLNMLWEKLTKYSDEFDFEKLQEYALKCNLTLKRTTGFLLDELGENSDKLYASVKGKNGYSRLTSKSKEFNSKWRLYYDHRIIE